MIEDAGAPNPWSHHPTSDAPRSPPPRPPHGPFTLRRARPCAVTSSAATPGAFTLSALAGFVLMTSYYYFVGALAALGKGPSAAQSSTYESSGRRRRDVTQAATMRWLRFCCHCSPRESVSRWRSSPRAAPFPTASPGLEPWPPRNATRGSFVDALTRRHPREPRHH